MRKNALVITKTIYFNSEISEQLGQNKYILFQLFTGGFYIHIGKIKMTVGTNNWDVDVYRKKLENIVCQFANDRLQVTFF